MKKLKDIDYYVDKLGCSISEAQELIEFDKNVDDVMKEERAQERKEKKEAEKPKAKTGIQDGELEMMFADIQAANLGEFGNKDLKSFLEKWKLTARQTPSRLKKLVEIGKLIDLGGSPKKYKIGD